MADRLIRVGRVSKIDYTNGMISVTFPDLDDATSALLSTASFNDEYKMPEIGDNVLTVHLPSGQARGVVLGKMWNEETNKPKGSGKTKYRKEFGHTYGEAYTEFTDGGTLKLHAPAIKFETDAGSITVAEIIALKAAVDALGE